MNASRNIHKMPGVILGEERDNYRRPKPGLIYLGIPDRYIRKQNGKGILLSFHQIEVDHFAV